MGRRSVWMPGLRLSRVAKRRESQVIPPELPDRQGAPYLFGLSISVDRDFLFLDPAPDVVRVEADEVAHLDERNSSLRH